VTVRWREKASKRELQSNPRVSNPCAYSVEELFRRASQPGDGEGRRARKERGGTFVGWGVLITAQRDASKPHQ